MCEAQTELSVALVMHRRLLVACAVRVLALQE